MTNINGVTLVICYKSCIKCNNKSQLKNVRLRKYNEGEKNV